MYFCTALNISLLRSKQNDPFSCKHKPMLMSALLFFGINSCKECNKTNLSLLYLEQINKKWSLSSNGHFWTDSFILDS
jgi:hypothetical protein